MILLNFYLILIEYTTFIKFFYAKYQNCFLRNVRWLTQCSKHHVISVYDVD